MRENNMGKRGTRTLPSGSIKEICPKSKRSQVTMFIIVGIIIVVLAILVYFFYPQIKGSFGFEEQTPSSYMKSCLEEKVQEGAGVVSLQGGSINPDFVYLYESNKVEVLCYSEQPYVPCVMQQPMLINHVEEELEDYIAQD